VPLVVATLGGDGVLLAERGTAARRRPAHRVEAVDTTGAGDTFCGVLAAALAAGADVDTAAGRATAAAALSVQRAGAIPSIPTAEEVQQIVERGT
jgi:ribokinase